MKRYNCEHCNDTGWYGDNGPGIEGNSEYAPCEECGRGKDRKCQARAIQVDSPLRRFTDAMHEVDRKGDGVDGDCYTTEGLLKLAERSVRDLDNAIEFWREKNKCDPGVEQTREHAIRLALIAAEIAGRVS